MDLYNFIFGWQKKKKRKRVFGKNEGKQADGEKNEKNELQRMHPFPKYF